MPEKTRQVKVTLYPANEQIAAQIATGNVSKGIRMALKFWAEKHKNAGADYAAFAPTE